MIAISDKLFLLADIFAQKTTLYIVGGYVRDSFLNVSPKDIDLASSLTCDEVIELLHGSCFKVVFSIKNFGKLVISTDDDKETYEYTTFREDIYRLDSGLHRPSEIKFTKDIKKDALRRDFKINAIYFDILKEEYVDPIGGIQDLIKSTISTTRDADIVFREDPLRILRMVRLACEMNIKIESNTLYAAKKNSYLVYNLSQAKKKEEFIKMVYSDLKYSEYKNRDKYSHYRAIKILLEINAIDYILKDFSKLQNYKLKSNQTALEHTLESFRLAEKDIRFLTLIYNYSYIDPQESKKQEWDIFKNSLNYIVKLYGPTNLDLDKREIKDIKNLIKIRDFNFDRSAKENTIKRFIAENSYIIEKFLKMRKVDILARIKEENEDLIPNELYKKIKDVYDYIKKNNIPHRIKDLKVTSYDCYEIGIPKSDASKALIDLLKNIICTDKYREREYQLNFLKGHKKNKENSKCKE